MSVNEHPLPKQQKMNPEWPKYLFNYHHTLPSSPEPASSSLHKYFKSVPSSKSRPLPFQYPLTCVQTCVLAFRKLAWRIESCVESADDRYLGFTRRDMERYLNSVGGMIVEIMDVVPFCAYSDIPNCTYGKKTKMEPWKILANTKDPWTIDEVTNRYKAEKLKRQKLVFLVGVSQ